MLLRFAEIADGIARQKPLERCVRTLAAAYDEALISLCGKGEASLQTRHSGKMRQDFAEVSGRSP